MPRRRIRGSPRLICAILPVEFIAFVRFVVADTCYCYCDDSFDAILDINTACLVCLSINSHSLTHLHLHLSQYLYSGRSHEIRQGPKTQRETTRTR